MFFSIFKDKCEAYCWSFFCFISENEYRSVKSALYSLFEVEVGGGGVGGWG